MRRRISIRGRVRPSVRPSVRRSVPCCFRRWKVRILGAVYPALFPSLNSSSIFSEKCPESVRASVPPHSLEGYRDYREDDDRPADNVVGGWIEGSSAKDLSCFLDVIFLSFIHPFLISSTSPLTTSSILTSFHHFCLLHRFSLLHTDGNEI